MLRNYNTLYLLTSVLFILVFFPLCFGLVLSFGEWSGSSDRRYRLCRCGEEGDDEAGRHHDEERGRLRLRLRNAVRQEPRIADREHDQRLEGYAMWRSRGRSALIDLSLRQSHCSLRKYVDVR